MVLEWNITGCLGEIMPEGALVSFILCDHRYFVGRALLIKSKSRSRMEYLLPTDSIIVFD